MAKQAGLWIDHRKAVVVLVTDGGEEIKKIASGMDKRVHFTGGTASEDGSTEDVRDRQFENYLNTYYDQVIAVIRDVDSIQIFGPGEAKGELKKRLEIKGLGGRLIGVETVDKMTDRQIAEKIRERLRKN
jgi:hypothetical protein